MSVLRDYLKEQYSISEHRETEDFCLEMLKTLEHNLRKHQERSILLIQMLDSQQKVKDLHTVISLIQMLEERTINTFSKYEKLLKEEVQ